ncbi:ATP-dependent DNA helicase PIF1-like [Colius striatus]|uniref:ATP-dependent DNA helicase PIF1-like n=1 Tax=Colius striatus TaxID=57412 RepID=UPI002B1D5C74|nr:ATP-dependent DNA helicase PIF1-like [Colius striatus]
MAAPGVAACRSQLKPLAPGAQALRGALVLLGRRGLRQPVLRVVGGEARGERPAEVPRAERRPSARLSAEQEAVLGAVRSGKSVFFTGCAGTGKSFLLKKIVGSLPPKSTYATASTGVAACHIGGTTLHAFAGIGSGKAPLEQCIQLAERPGVRQHWLACQHLIIDEISMVDGKFFDKLEAVSRQLQ